MSKYHIIKEKTFNQHIFNDYEDGKISYTDLITEVNKSPHTKTFLDTEDRYISTNYEQTDLRLAIRMADLKLVEYFIQRGDTLTEIDCYGNDVLMYCLSNGHLLLAEYLLEKHPNLINFNHRSHIGRNALRLLLNVKFRIDDPEIIQTHKSLTEDGKNLFDLLNTENNTIYDDGIFNKRYMNIFYILKEKQSDYIDKYGSNAILECSLSNFYFLPELLKNNFDYTAIREGFTERNFFILNAEKHPDPYTFDFSSYLLCKDGYLFIDRIYIFKKALNIIAGNKFPFGYEEEFSKLFLQK